MKIAYITQEEILGPSNTGGILCCKRNLSLLKQAFGDDNIHICAITKNKEYLEKADGKTTVFYSARKKVNILRNVMHGRLQFGKDVEKAVLRHVIDLDCSMAFFDSSRLGTLQEQLPKEIKQILFMLNIEKDYIRNLIRVHPTRIVLKRAFEKNEFLAVKYADKVISLNNRDAGQLKKYYDRSTDCIIPITMEDNFTPSNEDKENTTSTKLQLLFIGSLFAPNEHGVTWFVNEVMPYVNADFLVAGRDFEKLAHKLTRSNVNVIGTVDDLCVYYHNSDAIVSPILFGDGMKVKTAEALMYGKPMFATNEALEGYCVEDQENIFRCNNKEQFITAINEYALKKERTGFDSKLRNLFLEKYHTPSYIPVLKDLLQ